MQTRTAPSQAGDNKLHFKEREPHPASAWPARRADDEGLQRTVCHWRQVLLIPVSHAKKIFCPVGPALPNSCRNMNYSAPGLRSVRGGWGLEPGWHTQASLLSDGAGWGLGIKSADSNQKQLDLIERVKKVYNPNKPLATPNTAFRWWASFMTHKQNKIICTIIIQCNIHARMVSQTNEGKIPSVCVLWTRPYVVLFVLI